MLHFTENEGGAMEEKTEGVLLCSIAYLGNQRILKILTPETGLITLLAKKKDPSWTALTTPFCTAEWIYKKGREEIHLLKDGSLLDPFPLLRQNYETLLAAGSMAQDLLRSQFPSKRSADLYNLLLAYWKKLPSFPRPETLAASFKLKLLLGEGVLALQRECSLCKAKASCLSQGESYCPTHAPPMHLSFSSPEWEILQTLAFGRQFSLFEGLFPLPSVLEKIEMLFNERMD